MSFGPQRGLNGQVNSWVNNTAQTMPTLQPRVELPPQASPTAVNAFGAQPGVPAFMPPQSMPPAVPMPAPMPVPTAAAPVAPLYADKDAWRAARPEFAGPRPFDARQQIQQWRQNRPMGGNRWPGANPDA